MEHTLDALRQAPAAYLPAILAALVAVMVVGLVVVGIRSLRSARPAGADRCLAAREIVITEAGALAVLAEGEESWEIAADVWNRDTLPLEPVTYN